MTPIPKEKLERSNILLHTRLLKTLSNYQDIEVLSSKNEYYKCGKFYSIGEIRIVPTNLRKLESKLEEDLIPASSRGRKHLTYDIGGEGCIQRVILRRK